MIGNDDNTSGPYLTNGSVTNFPFDFSVAAYGASSVSDMLEVTLTHIATGVDTILAPSSDYSVNVNGDQASTPGGSITTVSTYPTGSAVRIRLIPPFKQSTSLQNNGPYNAGVVEQQFDYVQRQLNYLKERVGRGYSVPVGETATTLPRAAQRANQAAAFDANGDLVPVAGIGTAPISADMAGLVQGTRLNALYQLNKEIGIFIPQALTDEAVQAAINEANAAGGGCVLCAAETYVFDVGVVPASNVIIVGVHGRTKFEGAGVATISLVGTEVADVTAIAGLAVNAAENARSISLTSGAGVAQGDIIRIEATHPTSGEVHQWLTQVTGKSGATLTLADPMPLGVASADTHSISVVSPEVTNFSIRDIVFSRGTNAGAGTVGVFIVGGVDVELTGLVFEDLGGDSRCGYLLSNCLHVFLENLYTERCGSIGYAAQEVAISTGVRAQALRSYDDDGFGVLILAGAYNSGCNFSCTRSGDVVGGRGIKFASDLRGAYSTIISNNSAYTGVMISNHCIETQIENVVCIGNGFSASNHGLNISGEYNSGVRVRGVLAKGNSTVDIVVGSNDSDCQITDASFGAVSNSSATSSVSRPFQTALLAGALFGLVLSNNAGDATNDIDISNGRCVDHTGESSVACLAMTKRLDAGWAPGSGQGMRNSGASIADTIYHIYAVWSVTGLQDYYAHASPDASVALSSLQGESGGAPYVYARRIGAISRVSGSIVQFLQIGDRFLLKTPVQNYSSSLGTSRLLVTTSAPPGTIALLRVAAFNASTAGVGILVTPTYETDAAPSFGAPGRSMRSEVANEGVAAELEIYVDGSSQIAMRASLASSTASVVTRGWVDSRGRFA